MRRKYFRAAALFMLAAGAVFVVYALNNPQASFPWDGRITYFIYGAYILAIIVLFSLSLRKK